MKNQPDRLAADAITADSITEMSSAAILRVLLARVRRRTWLIAGGIVVILVAGPIAAWSVAGPYRDAASLEYDGGVGDWWFQQDASHEHVSMADKMTENEAPLRCGQRQGYVISLYNPTGKTQTIVGDAASAYTSWNNPGPDTEQLAVSTAFQDLGGGVTGSDNTLTFKALPADIPPFQTRIIRVMWTTTGGGDYVIDKLALRVRVGWFTRTEVIPQEAWLLTVPGSTVYTNCSSY